MATPKTTAKVFKKAKAAIAPNKTGIALCLEANVMQTNWLLSPISAAAIRAKLVAAVADSSVKLPVASNDKKRSSEL
jgi:hypothetical protein